MSIIFSAALRAACEPFLIETPGAPRPRTLRLLLPRGKSRQKRAKTYGSGLPPAGRHVRAAYPAQRGLAYLACHRRGTVPLGLSFGRSGTCRTPPRRPFEGVLPARGGSRSNGRCCKLALVGADIIRPLLTKRWWLSCGRIISAPTGLCALKHPSTSRPALQCVRTKTEHNPKVGTQRRQVPPLKAGIG